MREIKFRGRDLASGKWVYGDLHVLCDKPHIHTAKSSYPFAGQRSFVDPSTIGQFTGLYDEDKREIYEGDLVMCGAVIYEVKYSNGDDRFTGWVLVNEEKAEFCINQKMMSLSKVVGNIHDKAAGYTCADCGFFNEWDQHCDNPEVNLKTVKEAVICQYFKHK